MIQKIIVHCDFDQIWNKLVKPNNQIKKVTGDYSVRQGVTQKPLADIDFCGKFYNNVF